MGSCLIVVEKLGVNPEDVSIHFGDSEDLPSGGGTGGSKSLYFAAGAINEASDDVLKKGIEIAAAIRQEKISAIIGPSRGIKSQMKYASSINATHVIIIGDDEINNQTYQVKNLNTGGQEEISQENLINFFKKLQ